MKKVIIVCAVLIFISAIILANQISQKNTPKNDVTQFTIANCLFDMYNSKGAPYFIEGINIGPVSDEDDAVNKAIILWKEQYNSEYEPSSIKASYVPEAMCWIVYDRRLEPYSSEDQVELVLGRFPIAIIKSNGEVMGSWLK